MERIGRFREETERHATGQARQREQMSAAQREALEKQRSGAVAEHSGEEARDRTHTPSGRPYLPRHQRLVRPDER